MVVEITNAENICPNVRHGTNTGPAVNYHNGTIGIFSDAELSRLWGKKVAVLGLGRSGGRIAIDLAPFIGNLVLADNDVYVLENIAVGQPCDMTSVGSKKTDVVAKRILQLNPNVSLELHSEGVTEQNVESLIEDCALVLEGIDVTQLQITRHVHLAARKRHIPVMTVVHVGFGVNVFTYHPTAKMTWEEHLGVSESTTEIDLRRFCPHLPGGLDPQVLREVLLGSRERIPTFLGAVVLGSSIMLSAGLMYLLGKADLVYMPEYLHADLYARRLEVRTMNAGFDG
ncbi:MAG: ThiF family adenylyltransferase [Anaerolineae bacterium]|nr:ThiF family adenylyltransferase [Anaerolineae bacterium]MCB0206257.1 ThiF family adenylyltransferase [Anaerolineae bacterium]